MQPPRPGLQRLVIVGLPRSGTTLVATLLAAQSHIHFLTDYFPAFTDALARLRKTWNAPLSQSERRIALAVVRDQFLRVRHPVLVKLDSFTTLDQLHELVLGELASGADQWVGHKLLMSPELLRSTLSQTQMRCLLLLRDPRDAALSYFHRTGGGVERYLRNWCETAQLWRELEAHPRLLMLRFEDLVADPAATLHKLGAWLGMQLDTEVPELQFQRSRAHGSTAWRENSAFQDVSARFDRQPLGRWRMQARSPIVRYAGWVARRELPRLGYEAPSQRLSARERLSFACLKALEVTEHQAYDSLALTGQWLRRHIDPLSAGEG
jgi:hypothetical protein